VALTVVEDGEGGGLDQHGNNSERWRTVAARRRARNIVKQQHTTGRAGAYSCGRLSDS